MFTKQTSYPTRMSNVAWIAAFRLLVAALVLSVCFGLSASADSSTGRISGKVVDHSTGEAIIGATVMLDGTSMGAKVDLDGNYWVRNVPAGSYTLVVTSIQHQEKRLIDVVVTAGEVVTLDIALEPQATQLENVITVQAKFEQNSRAAVLKVREEANSVSDVISSEDISRSGSGHAADAMSKVTGATVVEGRYVYIRGLGDRYTNTHLNGSPLPSPDPESQSVPTDLVPSGLLDNIVLEKTFTPDKPGNFAGGSANLNTKDYPSERTLSVSVSSGYNSQSTGNDMLTHTHSGSDWLGMDDGYRDLPDVVVDNPELREQMQNIGSSFINIRVDDEDSLARMIELVDFVDELSNSFNKEMDFTTKPVPWNQGYSVAYGDFYQIGERPLGIVASLSYSRKYKLQDDGLTESRIGTNAGSLENTYNFVSSKDNVLWGGLADVTFGIHPNHKLGASFMHTTNGESSNEYYWGNDYYHVEPEDTLRRRWIKFTERNLNSIQVRGEHLGIPGLGGPTADWRSEWRASFSDTKQEQPDARYLADVKSYSEDRADEGLDPWYYWMGHTVTDKPYRAWRTLEESNNEYRYDLEIPLARETKFKTGASYLEKDRTYEDIRFAYRTLSYYDGDIDGFVSNVGGYTIDTISNGRLVQIRIGNFLEDGTQQINQYTGFEEIFATYLMLSTPLSIVSDRLSFVGGLRYETTRLHGEVAKEDKEPGDIDDADWLPSINLVYALRDDMKLRASYGRTLARPTMREITPSHSEEFGDRSLYHGNPDLIHTRIDNLDFRWEWFVGPGEVIAASLFYKDLENPIELVFIGQNGGHQTQNVPRGHVYGIELEYRRRLDWLTETLRNFQIGGNLTLVKSDVDPAGTDVENYPELDHSRPLANQSPYVVNLDLGYSNSIGTSASIYYNVFGRRLAVNSQAPSPDVYEESRHQLDFMASQRLFGGPKVKFSVKNILSEDVLFVYDRESGPEAVYKKYSVGVSYGLGMSYDIW